MRNYCNLVLKSGFERTINWNKYQSERSIERQKPYLDYLIDSRVIEFLFYRLKMMTIEKHTQDIFIQRRNNMTVD